MYQVEAAKGTIGRLNHSLLAVKLRTLFLACLFASGIIVLAWPSTALGHDSLISSTPAPDEQLADQPSEVVLNFTNEVLPTGAEVQVLDSSGRNWVTGKAQIDGPKVSAELDPEMPQAGYQVVWRVVSGDGHPISSLIPFAIGDAEPLTEAVAAQKSSEPKQNGAEPTAETSNSPSSANTTPAEESARIGKEGRAASESAGTGHQINVGLLIILLVAAPIIIFGVGFAIARFDWDKLNRGDSTDGDEERRAN